MSGRKRRRRRIRRWIFRFISCGFGQWKDEDGKRVRPYAMGLWIAWKRILESDFGR